MRAWKQRASTSRHTCPVQHDIVFCHAILKYSSTFYIGKSTALRHCKALRSLKSGWAHLPFGKMIDRKSVGGSFKDEQKAKWSRVQETRIIEGYRPWGIWQKQMSQQQTHWERISGTTVEPRDRVGSFNTHVPTAKRWCIFVFSGSFMDPCKTTKKIWENVLAFSLQVKCGLQKNRCQVFSKWFSKWRGMPLSGRLIKCVPTNTRNQGHTLLLPFLSLEELSLRK